MAPANNSLRASIPSLAAIEHHRRELLAWQAAHRAPSPAPLDDPAAKTPTWKKSTVSPKSSSPSTRSRISSKTTPRKHPTIPIPSNTSTPLPPRPSLPLSPSRLSTAWPASLSVASLRTPRPTLRPSSCNSSPPSATSSAPRLTAPSATPVTDLTSSSSWVGESSKARKGTSWRQISSLFTEVDPLWVARRITTARPTAYGIIHALRDQDPPTDRRLFLLAEEFASVLHMLGQRTGQLSPLLRCAWDGGDLSATNGSYLFQATKAHLSIVAHITESERAQHLTRIEAHNGFANRCLWTSVRRGQLLPDGGSLPPDQLAALARELRRTVDWAQSQTEILFRRSPAARELWIDRYPDLNYGRQDAYGAATSRAEAQVLRLSALYAALDCSAQIELAHLQAALAVWDYCLESARLFFNDAPLDPTARRISEAISAAAPGGLSKMQIYGVFHGHVSKDRIDLALEQLKMLGLIDWRLEPGRGRSTTIWTPAGGAKDAGRGA